MYTNVKDLVQRIEKMLLLLWGRVKIVIRHAIKTLHTTLTLFLEYTYTRKTFISLKSLNFLQCTFRYFLQCTFRYFLQCTFRYSYDVPLSDFRIYFLMISECTFR